MGVQLRLIRLSCRNFDIRRYKMSSSKILIGNDTPDQGIAWANMLKTAGAFAVTRKPNGLVLLQYVREYALPDVLIIEAKMAGMDAVGLVNELKKLGDLPAIIVTADFPMPSLEDELMFLGAKAFMVKPFEPAELMKKIAEVTKYDRAVDLDFDRFLKEPVPQQDLECIVTDIIHQIGIPAHIKGYHFLRYAIMLCVDDNEMINCITKQLWGTAAW